MEARNAASGSFKIITESLLVTRATTTTTTNQTKKKNENLKEAIDVEYPNEQGTENRGNLRNPSKLNSLVKINRREYKGNVVDHVTGQPQHRSVSD